MPVTKKRLPGGKVRVSTPGGTKSKATSPAKAAAQERLLNALESNPEFTPAPSPPKMMMPKPAKRSRPSKPPAPKVMPKMLKAPMMNPGDMQMPMGMPPMMSMKPKQRKGMGRKGK